MECSAGSSGTIVCVSQKPVLFCGAIYDGQEPTNHRIQGALIIWELIPAVHIPNQWEMEIIDQVENFALDKFRLTISVSSRNSHQKFPDVLGENPHQIFPA
jgi:hypothetical protein